MSRKNHIEAGYEETASKKTKKNRKLSGGKILAVVIGLIVTVYMLFTLQVFYTFMKLLTDSDTANHGVSSAVSAETAEYAFISPL